MWQQTLEEAKNILHGFLYKVNNRHMKIINEISFDN